MSKFSIEALQQAITALEFGEFGVFQYTDLSPLGIEACALKLAKKSGFSVKVSADYGGVRITKTYRPSKLAAILRLMKDGHVIRLPRNEYTARTIERATERLNVPGVRYYDISFEAESIEVCLFDYENPMPEPFTPIYIDTPLI